MMEARAKGYSSPSAANGQSPSSGSQSPIVAAGGSSTGSSSPGTPQQPAGLAQSPQSPSSSPSPPPPPLPTAQTPERPAPSPGPPATAPAPAPTPVLAQAASPAPQPQKRSFISRLFGAASTPEPPAAVAETWWWQSLLEDDHELEQLGSEGHSGGTNSMLILVNIRLRVLCTFTEEDAASSEAPPSVQSVDDFVPDDRLDKSFLEDSVPSKARMNTQPQAASLDSDSDGEGKGGNPMVAGFQDDLDPDDTELSQQDPRASVLSKNLDITLSSDEGEDGAQPVVAQDVEVELTLDDPLDDLNSLTLEDKPKPLETVPSAQPNTSDTSKNLEPSILIPAPAQPTHTPHTQTHTSAEQPVQHSKRKTASPQGDSSDSDPEAPAAQMLSFVMDDPDFESEEERVQKVEKEAFPVRADLSDLSDDELVPTKVSEPQKSSALSFKHKNDSDLFGLGFEEKTAKSKDSSDEQEGKFFTEQKESRHSTKEKKKKKKKIKEEEEKSSKKKHKHKKKEREEAAGAGEEKEKKKKKSRSKKAGELDDLEAFLAGGEGSTKREEGDYEEL
ncbi:hypothetical protein NFI96_000840 [Prochilodus magdalenae]|nr:hypothetical protein NFI96_000840 [Prochilodus magdalenae]